MGNIRLSYADDNRDGKIDVLRNGIDVDGDGDNAHEIREESNYYPFGLKQKGYNSTIQGRQDKYKFNGQELNETLGYNMTEMTFRHYDNALGRFVIPDPLAEQAMDWTPYRFGFNNPIVYSDPLGLMEEWGVSGGNHYGGYGDSGSAIYWGSADSVQNNHGFFGPEYFGSNIVEAFESVGLEISRDYGSGDWVELDELTLTYRSSISYVSGINSVIDQINGLGFHYSDQRLFGLSKGDPAGLAIIDLTGWSHTAATIQDNLPYLFGRRKSADGQHYIDAQGNSTGRVPMGAPIDLPVGPGSGLKGLKYLKNPADLKHIFRSAPGHVNPSTIASQQRYLELFNSVINPKNLVATTNAGKVKAGIQTFQKTFRGGKQVWVETLGGKIKNAGVNIIPR